jgi:ATP-dependent helicase/nuclease subunit A
MTAADRAVLVQTRASDPAASVWLSASAGTGKTWVLADRVTRLLLQGVRPGAILCLTYTKAAAAEMESRIYRRLGEWVTADDAALGAQLARIMPDGIKPADLARARRLFTATLDAPGRLRIHTIHAFCESLLKRFPVEAAVSPSFTVVDELVSLELQQAARNAVIARAAGDAAIADTFAGVVRDASEQKFGALVGELVGARRKLHRAFARHGEAPGTVAALHTLLGVAVSDDEEADAQAFAAAAPLAELKRCAAALAAGLKTDAKRAEALRRLLSATDRAGQIDSLWNPAFLTVDGAIPVSLATKSVSTVTPDVPLTLRREAERLLAYHARRTALRQARASASLIDLAALIIAAYDAHKARRATLDYDDLIRVARDLLRPEVNPWVMFKLDGGIEHILVDEAQDTSLEQWEIVEALSGEFFAGSGRHGDRLRTIFAVGDEKQSIFSFQGAAPALFAEYRKRFAGRAGGARREWRGLTLDHSRRSTLAILRFVDAVFARDAARGGVVRPGETLRHREIRQGEPGFVELWPLVEPEREDVGRPWDAPLDYAGERSPATRLAQRITQAVKSWLGAAATIDGAQRVIEPSDVLILVRRRNAFFTTLVRALKSAGIPVAGADRFVLNEELAVLDLIALARFALLPEDDLTLATVLKGPLFGFDDDQLFALAHARAHPRLWRTLRAHADERPQWRRASDALRRLLAAADRTGPYDFFADILSADDGRRKILARLGDEAAEPLEEFLNQALAFERRAGPSLQDFVAWFDASGAEIKRDQEVRRAEVRVMTVHGAKGLEAPIVILPDTTGMPDHKNDPKILWSDTDVPMWSRGSRHDTDASGAARTAHRQSTQDEYRRLLYVALTRARDRLVICGWRGQTEPDPACWYQLCADAFADLAEVREGTTPWGVAHRFTPIAFAEPDAPATPPGAQARDSEPAWLRRTPDPEPSPARPLAPSRPALAEPAVTSPLGPDLGRRFQRGQAIHRLLQVLPELPAERRARAAARVLAPYELDDTAKAECLATTLKVIDHPEFAPIFGPGTLAEAPLAGRVGDMVIAGQVDRLLVTDEHVLVLDYKTNRPPPRRAEDVPALYLGQMAAYRALLRAVFPNRQVRCALLWTEGPDLMELPDPLLDRATLL